MLSAQLKEETKQLHQLLEKKLIPPMRLVKTTEAYGALLKLFYSYFGGLELLVNKYMDETILPDYLQRRKTAALADDLIKIGEVLPHLAAENELPPITSLAHAAGAMYVMEGSTLGGSVISKMLQQQSTLPETAFTFFNSYGNQAMAMWQIFKQAIDIIPFDDKDRQAVIETANNTFRLFGKWIDEHQAVIV